jgi:MFS transporter, ACS family, glucarate transporter
MSSPTTSVGASPYRWLILLLSWAAFTMTSVDRSTWGPASASVGESLAVPLAALGTFATAYYVGYVLSNLGGGFLVDWLGGRLIMSVSGIGAGIFMILFGSTTSIAVGLALQAAVGLLAGVDFAAGLKLLSAWFAPEKRGFAVGIFVTATSLGTVIANAVVPSLIIRSGWEVSYHVFGVVTIVIGVACAVLIRNGIAVQEQASTGRRLPDVRPLLHNRDILLLGLAGFGGLWGTYGFVTWSNTLMVKGSGISPVDAGVVLVLFAGIAVGIKPVVGWIVDRLGLGMRLPAVAILGFFGVMLLVFGNLTSLTQYLWLAPLLGIGAYAYTPLTTGLIPLLAGPKIAGSAAGAVNAFWQLGSVTVPTVIGIVYAANGSFAVAFAALAAGPIIGAGIALFIREPRRKHEHLSTAAAEAA